MMEFKIIKSNEIEEQDFGTVKVQNLLMEESYDKFSIAKVEIIGEPRKGFDKESDVVYYVLDGEGKFFIEGEEFNVEKGDLVFLPKGTKYKDEGNLKLLAISVPKFDRNKREYVDE